MKKRILIVLSGNLSTTPRAMKCIESFGSKYQIDVIAVNRGPQWSSLDQQIRLADGVSVNTIDLVAFSWMKVVATLVQRVSKLLNVLFRKHFLTAAFASDKTNFLIFWQLMYKLRKVPDLIFAFSGASLFGSAYYAQKHGVPFFVDVEDYYPGELQSTQQIEVKRRELILKETVSKASYVYFSSEHILKKVEHLVGKVFHADRIVLNSFPIEEFENENLESSDRLRFIWFSQTIGSGRGLELVVPLLYQHRESVLLTLFGTLDAGFFNEVLKPYEDILDIQEPVPQGVLHQKLSQFDIGLALEMSTTSLNRDLTLTNKILAYAQSGLYIIATDTSAQVRFLEEYSIFGSTCKQSVEAMSNTLATVLSKRDEIRETRNKRYAQAKALAWEHQFSKIDERISNLLD